MIPFLSKLLNSSPKRRTAACRTAACRSGLGIESLEPRQMLAAADLTIANEVLVEVEPLGVNVHIASTLVVVNSGPVALIANDVHLVGVLSTDQIFGNGDDVELDLDLLDLNLFPGTIANGSISGSVNQEHYQAANYLLIKIDPDDAINEVSENNNLATLALPQLPTLTTSAGQTSGKTNRPIRVDPGITFTDSPSQNFSGGQLRVAVDNDDSDHNILSIKRIKTDTGVLRRKQNELRLGTSVIGTISGGAHTQPLVITFTGAVGVDEVEKIASAVSLRGKKGVTGVRSVEFFVVEPSVVVGFVASKQVALT